MCIGRSNLHGWLLLGLGVLSATVAFGVATKAESATPKRVLRPWQLQDSVELRYVAVRTDNPALRMPSPEPSNSPFQFSPDGKYFFFISTWGDVHSDTDVNELSVYRISRLRDLLLRGGTGQKGRPLPDFQAKLQSNAFMWTAIMQASWDEDSRAIYFLGITQNGSQQLHRLDLESGRLQQLSDGPYVGRINKITVFGGRGSGVVYADRLVTELPEPTYPVDWVSRRPDGSFVRDVERRSFGAREKFYAKYGEQQSRQLTVGGDVSTDSLSFSPNGAVAIGFRFKASSAHARVHFYKLDVAQARIDSLPFDADYLMDPSNTLQPGGFWSADGSRVVLANAAAPGEKSAAVLEYELRSGKVRVLEPIRIEATSSSAESHVNGTKWLTPGKELLVTHESGGQQVGGTVYLIGIGRVEGRHVEAKELNELEKAAKSRVPQDFSVRLQQSANESPAVVAAVGNSEIVLTETDAVLSSVSLSKIETIHWQGSKGESEAGGLLLPAARPPGKPLPLVIQAYHYEPTLFLPDGSNRSIDAAQSLVARGMAVLQVALPPLPNGLDPNNPVDPNAASPGELLASRVDSAVQMLAKKGIVDPEKVGLTGFSAAGREVYYMVTHPTSTPLAAAVASDFFSGTYAEYLADSGGLGDDMALEAYEAGRGGAFWQNKAKWLENEPSFNADRIRTPLLYSLHSNDAWSRDQHSLEIIGAFRSNKKPLEYLYFGKSNHVLVRPLERLASTGAVVDWMAFWLQGYEDPSPNKARQYARWRPMLYQQYRSLQVPRKPKTKFIEVPEDFDAAQIKIENEGGP